MLPHILPYQFPIFIRIAVNTTMTACIIRSNIAAKKTPTAIPLRLLPCRNPNLHSDSVFQNFPRHASGDIDPELTKMSPLAAGTNPDSIACPYSCKLPADFKPLTFRNVTHTWEIPLCLLIKINKTNHTLIHISTQRLTHLLKCCYVKRNAVLLGQKDRVIPPAYRLPSKGVPASSERSS